MPRSRSSAALPEWPRPAGRQRSGWERSRREHRRTRRRSSRAGLWLVSSSTAGDPHGRQPWKAARSPAACPNRSLTLLRTGRGSRKHQNGKPPPGSPMRDCNLLIEFLVEAAGGGQAPWRCIVVSERREYSSSACLRARRSRTATAVGPAAQIDDPLDKLNRHFRAVAMMQDALDQPRSRDRTAGRRSVSGKYCSVSCRRDTMVLV